MEVGVAVISVLVVVAVVFGLGWLVVRLADATVEEEAQAPTWRAATFATPGGMTSIEVVQEDGDGIQLGRIVIAEFSSTAVDWEEQYFRARADAESRVALLNSES